MSTHYVPKYARKNFMPTVDLVNRKGRLVETITVLDTLNPKLTNLVKNLTSVEEHVILGGESLPNIAYKYYKTTSLYWLLCMYNGIIHPLDLVIGKTLLIPSLTQLNQNINQSANIDKLGEVVQI